MLFRSQALQAEGLSMNPNYRGALPHTMDWFKNRQVFGNSQLPWSSPSYQGDPNQKFPCPNANTSMTVQFNLSIYESWEKREAEAILKAFEKVDSAFAE